LVWITGAACPEEGSLTTSELLMQVLYKTRQGSLGRESDLDGLIEVVDKHMPEVLAIDDIRAKAEALGHNELLGV